MSDDGTRRKAAAAAGSSLFFALAPAVVISLANASFVRWYEEPTLLRRFGADYDAYRRAVPGWFPRRHPWTGATTP